MKDVIVLRVDINNAKFISKVRIPNKIPLQSSELVFKLICKHIESTLNKQYVKHSNFYKKGSKQ